MDLLTRELRRFDTGTYVPPTKTTVSQWLEKWLADYAEPSLRATTYRMYAGYIRRHVVPSIGHVQLAELRPDHVKAAHKAARDQGLSKLSVRHMHRILHKAINDAMTDGLVGRNVVGLAKPDKLDPRPKLKYQPEVVSAFLAEARKTSYGDALLLDLFLGLRRSELLGLRWEDVDFDQRKIYVRQTLHYVPQMGIIIYPTKNETSTRDMSMSDTVLLLLRAMRERLEAGWSTLGITPPPDTLVFADATGHMLSPNTFSMETRKIAERAGLQGVHLHLLRHWAASLALAQGGKPQGSARILGS
ncbi:MAG: site-specific integrase [Dehalococcoidia bacterium]|nr:site-specific integrase [Dehalococcoidia bacterium]